MFTVSGFKWGKYLVLSLVLLIGFRLTLAVVDAQSGDSNPQEPVNLSQSGVAANPLLVVSEGNTPQVWWQDPFVGYVYTQLEDRSWLPPVRVNVPFTEPAFTSPQSDNFAGFYQPTFVTEGNGRLHALWRNNRGNLLYSRAEQAALNEPISWATAQQIAESAVAWSAAVDANGVLHVGYVRTAQSEEFPAGVYYRYSDDNGANWSLATLVHSSDYLRPLAVEQANIQISVIENIVGLVWDSPLTSQIFFARSEIDEGTIWSPPTVIDARKEADDPGAAGPDSVTIHAENGSLHLIWRVQRQISSCLINHQVSYDDGLTWESPQTVFEGSVCANDYYWVTNATQPPILLYSVGQNIYLKAWDGAKWSQAQIQAELSEITDPITFRQLTLGCHQSALTSATQLVVLACTTGSLADIWWFERSLADISSWFPEEGSFAWEPPTVLFETTDQVKDAVLVIDPGDRFHSFWLQNVKDASVSGQQTALSAIYYSFWSGSNWSRPVPLIQLPDKVDQFSAVLAPDERLTAVWRNPETKVFYLSQVDIDDAWLPADWSTPHMLSWNSLISSPGLAPGENGELNAVYTVPINDGRGIYFIQQTATDPLWSQPVRVFDAAAAGWEMVDESVMARTANGDLHVLMTRYSLQPEAVPVGLYYVSSQDNGQTWSEPLVIGEGRIISSHMAVVAEKEVLVAWQEEGLAQPELRFRQSDDSGNTWSSSQRIASADVIYGAFTLLVDAANQVHWLQTSADRDGQLFLREWLWKDKRWEAANGLVLDSRFDASEISSLLAASIDRNGRLVALYDISEPPTGGADPSTRLFLTERLHDLPLDPGISTAATQGEGADPTPEPTVLPTTALATAVAEEIPTPDLSFADEPVVLPSSNSTTFSILIGIATAALVIAIIFGLSFWATRARKR